jgi:hypothetical protein
LQNNANGWRTQQFILVLRRNKMAIDDKLEKIVDEFAKNAGIAVQDISLHTALNLIPVAGSPISALLSGVAQRRLHERIIDLFQTMKEEIDKIKEESMNSDYFMSEEFQTLLALSFEQLQTTHDKIKLKLLGAALAHSGFKEFDAETRKEMFIRALRDLSAAHIQMLAELLPNFEMYPDMDEESFFRYHRPTESNYSGETLTMIQHLFALGFVEQLSKSKQIRELSTRMSTSWSREETLRQLIEFFSKPHSFEFRITELGYNFLKFLGITQQPAEFQFRPGAPLRF